MRKMLFALAMLVTGALAFATGSPASAAPVGAVTGLNDVVTSNGATTKVTYYWRGDYCYYRPWRCRRYDYGYRRYGYDYRRHDDGYRRHDYYYRRHHDYRRHYRPWWW